MTQRWKLTIEYDGSAFHGWQRQDALVSVQGCLEDAILKFSGEAAAVHAAGRTDSGVHATGQVAHFDLERAADAKTVLHALNFHLRPRPAAVVKAEPASPDFHARFSARNRVYRYTILSARAAPPVLGAGTCWHVWKPLDAAAMRAAALHLTGTHDFSAFRAAGCQAKSPLRSLDRLELLEEEDPVSGTRLFLWAEARSFLHHQIRNISGTLKMVGEGKLAPGDVKTILESRDRAQAGAMAPAEGLCFMRVDY